MTTAPSAKPRNKGQWAPAHREPLNAHEEFEKTGNPLDVRQRIEDVCAQVRAVSPSGRVGRFAMTEQGSRPTQAELRDLAARGAAELEGAGASEILRWADENFGGVNGPRSWATCNYVVASSMQEAVLIDLAAKVRPGVPVLFLDTGYHFVETIGTREAVASVYDIHVVNVAPEHTVAQQNELMGRDLFARDPGECCRLRKVEPLGKALRGYSAWVTGLRRSEAPTRANAPVVSFDDRFQLVKVNPLATWTDEDIQDYVDEHGVLVNPLVYEGYPSIGCAPCTSKPAEGADPRSGRWQGLAKTECGLHAS